LARQILQCVGKIKIGSSAHALYQTPNFRRHGKPNGIMPVLSNSPTSKSQSSGAELRGAGREPTAAARRPTTQATLPSADHAAEIARLQRENERLRMERDILKKSIAIFAGVQK
jgi:transposase-like protein